MQFVLLGQVGLGFDPSPVAMFLLVIIVGPMLIAMAGVGLLAAIRQYYAGRTIDECAGQHGTLAELLRDRLRRRVVPAVVLSVGVKGFTNEIISGNPRAFD